MLEQRRVALLGIAHLNKNQALDLMHRISGSGAIVQTARGGMFCGKHPQDPDRRVLTQFKKNLSGLPRSLDYILDGGGLTWDANAPDIEAGELLNTPSPEEKSAVDEAEEFLPGYLKRGRSARLRVGTTPDCCGGGTSSQMLNRYDSSCLLVGMHAGRAVGASKS